MVDMPMASPVTAAMFIDPYKFAPLSNVDVNQWYASQGGMPQLPNGIGTGDKMKADMAKAEEWLKKNMTVVVIGVAALAFFAMNK